MTIQLTQSRWQANTGAFGTLAEIGGPTRTPGGHYDMAIDEVDAASYRVTATARASQARDTACRQLRLRVNGLIVEQTSGPDAATRNPADVNRRCWSV